MERFGADPTTSVQTACKGCGEIMGEYRFFDNDNVGRRAILALHWQKTRQRVAVQPVVLCLQDTTEIDVNEQGART
jgi:hypothetical protein